MKPILFNTDMVRAIMEGRKTVTRRVVKPQPKYAAMTAAGIMTSENPITIENGLVVTKFGNVTTWDKMPYSPGDILYVRETWGDYSECQPGGVGYYLYRADYPENAKTYDFDGRICDLPRWRPSIHMPREAARIFLRVTDVRVERLQKMEIADFKAEGIICRRPKGLPGSGCDCVWKHDGCLKSPCANRDAYEYLCWREPFSELWDSTIKLADRALYGWEANPWVWVIEFERISKEEAAHG